MQREILLTADGSHTIAVPGMNVTYHSHHGAMAESMWVFVEAGFFYTAGQRAHDLLTILEIGFGTGLNALLTLKEGAARQQPVRYITIEPFPLTKQEVAQINHGKLLQQEKDFLHLHDAAWEKDVVINPLFTLHKKKLSLLNLFLNERIDCIYFDAFAPTDQPELWTAPVFENLYELLVPGGILVTYSSKSIIRKAMQAALFQVTKIPGPHGKRDMVRAMRPH
jgi:tRNA U34 5-methylaminomethyl-2-thiouridine-forming methyltransferase MnmC